MTRLDCEEALKIVLNRSQGKCPLCPRQQWSWDGENLNWSIFIHFSRSHKITAELKYDNNKLNRDNVDKIIRILYPDDK